MAFRGYKERCRGRKEGAANAREVHGKEMERGVERREALSEALSGGSTLTLRSKTSSTTGVLEVVALGEGGGE